MNSDEKEKLLDEVFEDGDIAAFRRQSVAQGLSHLRARRLRKRLAGACAVMCLAAAMLLVTSKHQPSLPHAPLLATVSPPHASPHEPTVQYVNDEQLLALFPHRPVALIGAPPHQRLIFLDKQPDAAEP